MTTSLLTLASLVATTPSSASSPVEFVVGELKPEAAAREAAAQLIADDAMTVRCGRSPALQRWRARRDGGQPETGSRRKAVEVFARIGFGLRDEPAPDDHLQGHVAELLWNRMLKERIVCPDGRRFVHMESVKADITEPGADGLVVYQVEDGTLVFRLWEIKKHESPRTAVSDTIARASKQLSDRAEEYIGKLAGPGTLGHSGPLGDLYAELVELWLDHSERAGAGVSVGTSSKYASDLPLTAFDSLAKKFPSFNARGQLEGVIVSIADFPAFAVRVREIVWSGL